MPHILEPIQVQTAISVFTISSAPHLSIKFKANKSRAPSKFKLLWLHSGVSQVTKLGNANCKLVTGLWISTSYQNKIPSWDWL